LTFSAFKSMWSIIKLSHIWPARVRVPLWSMTVITSTSLGASKSHVIIVRRRKHLAWFSYSFTREYGKMKFALNQKLNNYDWANCYDFNFNSDGANTRNVLLNFPHSSQLLRSSSRLLLFTILWKICLCNLLCMSSCCFALFVERFICLIECESMCLLEKSEFDCCLNHFTLKLMQIPSPKLVWDMKMWSPHYARFVLQLKCTAHASRELLSRNR
jgi:hypothetical protein